jgi:pyruvate formate lyase activating enzyme
MYDCCVEARKQGIGNVIISNGYIKKEPLVELCKVLSAVKIDFKGFTDKFYTEQCDGELQPVLDTLLMLRDIGIWYELVVLLIPTLNDSEQELRGMCAWVRKNLGPDVPIHFSRFHPMYKVQNVPPTPVRTLEKARRIGRDAGLNYVYLGNVRGHEGESTYCPKCGQRLIHRDGYFIVANRLKGGCCPDCKTRIPGVWGDTALP